MKEATSFLNLSSIDAKVGFEIDDFCDHENDENDFGAFEFILRQEYFSTQITKETMTDFDYNNCARRVHPSRDSLRMIGLPIKLDDSLKVLLIKNI